MCDNRSYSERIGAHDCDATRFTAGQESGMRCHLESVSCVLGQHEAIAGVVGPPGSSGPPKVADHQNILIAIRVCVMACHIHDRGPLYLVVERLDVECAVVFEKDRRQ